VNTANAQTLLAIICSGAPAADICVDPLQAATFLTSVTMARGMTMGAPLFGSATDFIATMKGQGQLGPFLASAGMKPVKFLSESEFAKSVSTESKVFSIYAVGVIKGYKRETRTAVKAVVDFRQAPQLSANGQPQTGNGTQTPPPAGSSQPPGSTPTTGNAQTDALLAAMQPNTGGQVIYFRIE